MTASPAVSIAVIGTLDTKGEEHAYLAGRIRARGAAAVLIDVGVGAAEVHVDIDHHAVAAAAGSSVEELTSARDRAHAVNTMARGAAAVLERLLAEGRLHGAIALGGGGGTTLAGAAFAALPVGVPKLIVSTVAAGDMRPHVRGNDLTFTYSVLDIAGLNHITRRIIDNAAGAITGMATVTAEAGVAADHPSERPDAVGVSSFGVTSPAVDVAAKRLAARGFQPLVFHSVGSGGQSLESLTQAGQLAAVLDLTTTELADELLGGVMSAGPDRLSAASRTGTPQVVSLGALEVVNLGPVGAIPAKYRGRTLVQHNEQMTLMRINAAESAQLGRRLADKLNAATGPTALFLPLRGTSSLATLGQPFHDARADAALFDAVRERLDHRVKLVELDVDINDPRFAAAMVDELVQYLPTPTKGHSL